MHRMRDKRANGPDARIAHAAARQYGVVNTAQLAAAGLGRSAIAKRVEAGRLHRIHRGVYAVGHRGLSNEGRWIAAVLRLRRGRCPEPSLGGRALDAARGTRRTGRRDDPRGRRPPQAFWHPPSPLPLTAGQPHNPTQAHRGHNTGAHDHRSAARRPSRPDAQGDPPSRVPQSRPHATPPPTTPTPSSSASFSPSVVGIACPRPRSTARSAPTRWTSSGATERLVVETDGYAAHRGRQAFEDDRERELRLGLRGYRVRRFTYAQVTDEPGAVAAALRTELR